MRAPPTGACIGFDSGKMADGAGLAAGFWSAEAVASSAVLPSGAAGVSAFFGNSPRSLFTGPLSRAAVEYSCSCREGIGPADFSRVAGFSTEISFLEGSADDSVFSLDFSCGSAV